MLDDEEAVHTRKVTVGSVKNSSATMASRGCEGKPTVWLDRPAVNPPQVLRDGRLR
jgi:hypothetical protein